MRRRATKDRTTTRLLYALMAMFMVASLAYQVMTCIAVSQQSFEVDAHPRFPFITDDYEIAVVKTLRPEALAAGLREGDRILTFNGEPYSGTNQWARTLGGASDALRPGDRLAVGVRHADGTDATAQILLTRREPYPEHLIIMGFLVEIVPPFICLLIGYWVVWARPRDRNAWLLLLLLTMIEVLYGQPNWWSGAWLVFLGTWYETFQALGILALLLFGIYFPERWRLDAKYPILKWLLLVPVLGTYPMLMWLSALSTYHAGSWNAHYAAMARVLDTVLNPLSLICVLVYWAAVIDKLRSATTADGRRRMRVLCAGSVLGLGSLLVVFILLPHIFPDPTKLQAVRLTGAVLLLAFPFSLGYVVVVQRALDVRILVRMGTRYALARATLLIVEAGFALFIVLRFLLPIFSKPHNLGVALPVTALVVAGLLKLFASRNSLSSRLQQWLDRKFFREAYDAEVVLSELSEQARGFTETGPLIETISRRISEVAACPRGRSVPARRRRAFSCSRRWG